MGVAGAQLRKRPKRLVHTSPFLSNSPEDIRTSLPQQALGSILHSLDQAVGTARGDDRRKFITSRRKLTDGSVEIDIDHPPAADQVVYAHGSPAGLQQPGFDDFTTTTRFRTCLRIDDEAFARIITYLARIICHDESCNDLRHYMIRWQVGSLILL